MKGLIKCAFLTVFMTYRKMGFWNSYLLKKGTKQKDNIFTSESSTFSDPENFAVGRVGSCASPLVGRFYQIRKKKMRNLRRLVEKLVLIFPASSRRRDEDVRTSPQPVIATHSRVSPVRLLAPLAVLPTKLRKAVEHSLFGRRALLPREGETIVALAMVGRGGQ